MKRTVIRPFNITSAFLMLIGTVMICIPIFLLVGTCINIQNFVFQNKNVIAIIGTPLIMWFGILISYVALHQRIILFDDHLEICTWKNGTPYKLNSSTLEQIKLPKTKTVCIYYSDLNMYGAFFAKDISQYIHKNSGFLHDQWMGTANMPIPIKMPKAVDKLRDVILFVKSDGSSFVIDGGNYGLKQIKAMFGEIENLSNLKASGRVEGDVKTKRSMFLTVFNSIVSLFAVILWLFVIPVSTVWLEGLLNHAHTPDNNSGLRFIYIFGLMFGGFASLMYYCSRFPSAKTDEDIIKIRKISKTACFILYPISVIAFVFSSFVF